MECIIVIILLAAALVFLAGLALSYRRRMKRVEKELEKSNFLLNNRVQGE